MSWRTTLGLALAATLTVAGIGAQTEVLFSETFTGPNRSQPAGWRNVNTPEGNQWYLRSGEFTSGNGDNIIQQDKRTWAVAEAGLGEGWSDYEIVVDAHMNQRNGGFMLVGRWDESGNHYAAVYETRNGVVECRIDRVFDDRTEVLAQITSEQDANLPNLANGQTRADGRTFRFVLQADLLTFFIDRREVLTVRDDSIRRGTAGLGQFENFVFFDNFRVIGSSPAQALAAAAPAIGEVYRLRIAENLPRQEARSYQRYLEDNGFFPVILNQNAAGQYEVLTGTFLSRDEAVRRGDFLASEGEIFAYDIVESTEQVDIAQELELAAESRLAYSVRVLATYNEDDADETERVLIEELGYFPVSVVEEGSQFAVLVGNFSDEQEATRLLPELLDEGFDQAAVVNTERDILIGATSLAEAGTGQEVLSGLSQGEQQEVQEFLERMRRAARGSSTLEEMQELQDLIFELQSGYSGLREAVDAIREQEREREERDRLVNRVTDAIDQENWNTAEREIQLLRSQYPDDPFVGTLEARIAAARGADQPIERPTGSRTEEAVNNYIATAQRQVDDGNLDLAIITIETALRELPSNARLQEYLSSLRAARSAQRPQPPAEPTPAQAPYGGMGGDNLLMYIIGGVVALLIVGFLIMWRRQSRALAELQRRPAPAATAHVAATPHEAMPDQMAPGGYESMPDPLAASGQGGIRMDPSVAEQDVAGLSALVLATLDSQIDTASDADTQPDMLAAGQSDKISLDFDQPTGGRAPAAGAGAEEDEGRVSLDFGLDDEESTEGGGEGSMVDLDFGLEEEAPPEPEPAPEPKPAAEPKAAPEAKEPPAPEPPAEEEELSPEPIGLGDPFADLEESKSTVGLSIEEPSLDPLPGLSMDFADESTKGSEPDADITMPLTPTAAAAGPAEKEGESIFTQRFSPAQEGNQPEEWVGAYDFASLTVVTDNTPGGTGAALRFEKSSGAGSAFYTCKFPEASGRVGIEFDLCCTEKNQYLLGLYFEHEENFRQSVHTVMHKTGDTITLRLQGKTCDYEFGKWVHVKYRIDLPTGLVDGSVDGKPVARNVPMLSMTGQQLPPSINTISIRDTLASEGIFLLANIRVYNA